jgi:hypothetical protein
MEVLDFEEVQSNRNATGSNAMFRSSQPIMVSGMARSGGKLARMASRHPGRTSPTLLLRVPLEPQARVLRVPLEAQVRALP